MTKEDIIRMAREADLVYWKPNSTFSDGVWWMDAGELGDELESFAALVAAAAKAEEREACAKVCDEKGMFHEVSQGADLCFEIAFAILDAFPKEKLNEKVEISPTKVCRASCLQDFA